jgi:hypothetical protein
MRRTPGSDPRERPRRPRRLDQALDRFDGELTRRLYPIVNGFLVRRAGGTISFSQEAGPPLALASAITGFFPRFAAPPGRPGWTGALYEQVQRRLHQAVSKRYFRALLAGEWV